jgi:hypothetical protein
MEQRTKSERRYDRFFLLTLFIYIAGLIFLGYQFGLSTTVISLIMYHGVFLSVLYFSYIKEVIPECRCAHDGVGSCNHAFVIKEFV